MCWASTKPVRFCWAKSPPRRQPRVEKPDDALMVWWSRRGNFTFPLPIRPATEGWQESCCRESPDVQRAACAPERRLGRVNECCQINYLTDPLTPDANALA